MEDLQKLKINIREAQYPFFEDEELIYFLQQNNGNINKTSYDCLIMKAETTGLNVSGLTTQDSSKYFKMLASKYRQSNSGVLL